MAKKRYFLVQEITEDQYYETVKIAGKRESRHMVEISCSGCMCLSDEIYLAYTDDNELEIALAGEAYEL